MKRIYRLLTVCLVGLSLNSCNDFLDYNPTAVVDEETAFSKPEEMVTAAMHLKSGARLLLLLLTTWMNFGTGYIALFQDVTVL